MNSLIFYIIYLTLSVVNVFIGCVLVGKTLHKEITIPEYAYTENTKLYSAINTFDPKWNREIFYIDKDGVFHWGAGVKKSEDTKVFADMINNLNKE